MALKPARAIRKECLFFAKSNATEGGCRQNRARFLAFSCYRLHDHGSATRENLLIDRSGRFIGSTEKKWQPIQLQGL